MALWSILPEIAAGMGPKATAAVRKAAADVQAHAAGQAPVDTGALKASIQAQDAGTFRSDVNVGVDYGIYQEYGTRFMPAQPFMTPAAEAVAPSFAAAMRSIVP